MLTTNPFDPKLYGDKLREECGVFGIWGADTAAAVAALGLHALQHRGQEAAGITSRQGRRFHSHRGMGRVGDIFAGGSNAVAQLPGDAAIGHVRYATTGETALRNVQPLFADLALGRFAVAHNGNISNAMSLRGELNRRGSIFQSTSDTEVIIHLVATSTYRDLLDRFIDALRRVEGAYSLVCLTDGADRVPRPARHPPAGDGQARQRRDLRVGDGGARRGRRDLFAHGGARRADRRQRGRHSQPAPVRQPAAAPVHLRTCLFRAPRQRRRRHLVYTVRKQIGAELARENGVDAEMVVPVPDSGVPRRSAMPRKAASRSSLASSARIMSAAPSSSPTEQVRHLGVKLKHNANSALIKGKRLVLIDDSIVRGTTSMKIVQMLRDAGADQVHMRIASPPTRHSCFYGVATPDRDGLLAANMDVAQMAAHIGADSLAFLSIEGLYRAVGEPERETARPTFCDACFTGAYPTTLTDHDDAAQRHQLQLAREFA
jgi:amidophosphoribosyltransferase